MFCTKSPKLQHRSDATCDCSIYWNRMKDRFQKFHRKILQQTIILAMLRHFVYSYSLMLFQKLALIFCRVFMQLARASYEYNINFSGQHYERRKVRALKRWSIFLNGALSFCIDDLTCLKSTWFAIQLLIFTIESPLTWKIL